MGIQLHNEESSVASSRSIGMELGSEGSILSTCTDMTDVSTCANLKCMSYDLTVWYIAPCKQRVLLCSPTSVGLAQAHPNKSAESVIVNAASYMSIITVHSVLLSLLFLLRLLMYIH